jgi:hypothetical protein
MMEWKVAARDDRGKQRAQNTKYMVSKDEKKANPQNSRRETPMQKAGLMMRMQNRRGKRPFRCSVEKPNKPQPPSSEAGTPVSEEIVFGIGVNNEEVSIILSSRHPKMSKSFVASKQKRHMSIQAFCTGGVLSRGCQEGNRGSSRPDLFCRPCLPEGGKRKKNIDACYFVCRCPPR